MILEMQIRGGVAKQDSFIAKIRKENSAACCHWMLVTFFKARLTLVMVGELEF
jgi:hypothetical protein